MPKIDAASKNTIRYTKIELFRFCTIRPARQAIATIITIGALTYLALIAASPNTRAPTIPVSYTHLDVYKRQ